MSEFFPAEIRVIDSHTEGEPTRVIIAGGPPLRPGTLKERRVQFGMEFDDYRTSTMLEPRGFDAIVGALLVEPHDPSCDAGVIFFNNAGYLGMCVHGTIGVAATLEHLGRLKGGKVRLDTPAGIVDATRNPDGSFSVQNVASYRYANGVMVQVPGFGEVTGDIAYGGNWFFLVEGGPVEVATDRIAELTQFTLAVKSGLALGGITGKDSAEIDHIEVFGAPLRPDVDSKNFVLCPGGAYDRSPCGTGLSAKVACLAASGKLMPNQVWRQESIIGSRFEAGYIPLDDRTVIPTITGRAFITAESTLLFSTDDPFVAGIKL